MSIISGVILNPCILVILIHFGNYSMDKINLINKKPTQYPWTPGSTIPMLSSIATLNQISLDVEISSFLHNNKMYSTL